MKWTDEQLTEVLTRMHKAVVPAPTPKPRHAIPQAEDGMNKLEARYVREVLDIRKMAGEIRSWRFEAVKLRLAKRTWYTPDFLVEEYGDQSDPGIHFEFHETKGHWEDDARVKIKVAAEMYREFKFVAVQYKKGVWVYEKF